MKMFKNKSFLTSVVVSLMFCILILYFVEFRQIVSAVMHAGFGYTLPALALLLPGFFIRTLRWKIIYDNAQNNITFINSLLIYLTGTFLNAFLPASSGDIAKSFVGYRISGKKERMVSVSLADKIIGLSSITFLGFPAALYIGKVEYVILSLVPLGLFFLFFVTSMVNVDFIKNFKLYRKLKKIVDFHLLHKELKVPFSKIIFSFVLSVIAWILTFLIMALCFRAMNLSVTLLQIFAIAPIYALIRMFPFSLNGLGTDEMALMFLFNGVGAADEIVAAGLLFRVVNIICPALIGGIMLIIWKKKYTRPRSDS